MKKLLAIAGILFLFGCGKESTLFEKIPADQSGILFINTITTSDSFNILNSEYMYNGGGVGIGDVDQNGFQDILLTGNQVSTRLYLNNGDFTFTDISSVAFPRLDTAQWHSGVSVADVNGDGLPDFYFTSTCNEDPERRRNNLWIHQGMNADGIPVFAEQAEQYGVADTGYSVNSAFLDMDLDGDLDLYVMNNIVNQQIPTTYRDKLTDGSAVNNDHFYTNNGDGTFTETTIKSGITYEGFGLGLAVGDVNGDHYPDIYISNDYISNDLLYINQQDGTFSNEAETYLSYSSKFSMGNDMADINHDGHPDIMTVDMLPEVFSRKRQTINGNSYQFYVNDDKYEYQHQYVRNMVHLHNGLQGEEMVPFSEVGQLMGVYQTEWSWSPLFADYDNDGDKDLLITNGFPKDLTDKDFTNYKAQMYGYLATEQQVLNRIPEVKVHNYAYENIGGLVFEDRTSAWGMEIPSYSNGASFVDLDNDGDLDYVCNNIDDPAFVFRNTSEAEAAHYLKVALRGEGLNTDAFGARIDLWAGDLYLSYQHHLTRGYISSVEPIAHFGLGQHRSVDSLVVTWPGGTRKTIMTDLKADQVLELSIERAEAVDQQEHSEPVLPFIYQTNLIDYEHDQDDYIDFFQAQRIIPRKFSQIGPCMAKGDLNGDGMDDLLIAASDKLPTRVFFQTEHGFQAGELEGLTTDKECTESDLIILDVDGDGDQDVVAVSGGYQYYEDKNFQHFLYLQDSGTFTTVPLDIPPFIASVVLPFDADKDGDLDLFIGARVKRNELPYSLPSHVLMNEEGVYKRLAEDGLDIGMVTDAVASDVNGDGWEDLVITRDWNSALILANQDGKGFTSIEESVLGQKHGLWSSVLATDLDGDGDDDYLLGNLGQNHAYHVSNKYKLRMYGIDIDNNGTIDPIRTAYWKNDEGEMTEFLVNYLDELAAQSPFFRSRFTSYTEFSQTGIPLITPMTSVPEEKIFYVNTTSHYVLWNDDGNLSWEELPAETQIAPIREMMSQDFIGTGSSQVLLAGNDHCFDVSTGYYSANRGQILTCDEAGKFNVVPVSSTGLRISGQVESLAWFEDTKKLLVVGINRQKLQVYERNE